MKKLLLFLLLIPFFAYPQGGKRYRSIIIDNLKALSDGVIDAKDTVVFDKTILLNTPSGGGATGSFILQHKNSNAAIQFGAYNVNDIAITSDDGAFSAGGALWITSNEASLYFNGAALVSTKSTHTEILSPISPITDRLAMMSFGFIGLYTQQAGSGNVGIIIPNTSTQSYTSSNESNPSIIIGAQNSTINTGVINSVILGGVGITAIQDNTIYMPHLSMAGSLSVINSVANTVPIMTIGNTAGDYQLFRTDATPESSVTGSIGDLAVDGTNGEIYIKQSGNATSTGWQPVGGGVSAFSSMWYYGAELTTTITTVNTFTKITSFENISLEDDGGNVVSDPTTDDDITINIAGTYNIGIGSSFKNASGSNKNMIIVPKIILASALTITDATNATPIVVTSASHGRKNGDMVTISGVVGNTAANGDFVCSNVATNTIELENLAFVDVAGNGAYTSGGTIDAVYLGEMVLNRVVSGTDLGRGMAHGRAALVIGDVIELHVANTSDANNFILKQVSLCVRRLE